MKILGFKIFFFQKTWKTIIYPQTVLDMLYLLKKKCVVLSHTE